MIPNILMEEGGFPFVILGLLLPIFQERLLFQYLSPTLITLICYLTDPASIQRMMIFAGIPMCLTMAQKVEATRISSRFFYPLHINLIYILASFMG